MSLAYASIHICSLIKLHKRVLHLLSYVQLHRKLPVVSVKQTLSAYADPLQMQQYISESIQEHFHYVSSAEKCIVSKLNTYKL